MGTSNLIFPITSLLTYSFLGLRPSLVSAIGGQVNESVLKRAVRNPIDAMLYNAVPIQVKGRARAFVNGLLMPLGILIAGGLPFLVPPDAPLTGILVGPKFLEQMEKPDVELIEGLSPAISIDQRTVIRNPRSTAGTVSEMSGRSSHDSQRRES